MFDRYYLILFLALFHLSFAFADDNNLVHETSNGNLIKIDSLYGLLYDTFFFDEVLSNFPFCYNIPDKFDKNVVSLIWAPSRFTNVVFDGIPLNSIMHGDFDFFRLPYNISHEISVNSLNTSNYELPSSLIGSISMRTVRQNTNASRLNVQGGNASGSSHFQYNSGSRNIFWNLSGNFFITNGHSISADKPDTVNILRQNSKSRHESIFGKIGIRDDNSLLMLSLFWSGLNRQINSNIFYDTLRLNETYGGLALINLEFESRLNPTIEFNGNVYYKASNRKIDITSEFIVRDLFNEIVEDEYTIGANLVSDVKLIELLSSKFHITYRRDIASLTKFSPSLATYNRFTSEHLSTKFALSKSINSLLDASAYVEHAIYHPISSSGSTIYSDLSSFNIAFSLGLNLFCGIRWENRIFIGEQVPPLGLLNDDFAEAGTKTFYGTESGKSFNSTLSWNFLRSRITFNYQVSEFKDIFIPHYTGNDENVIRADKYSVHGIGIDFSTQFYNFCIAARGDHKLNNDVRVAMFRSPKSQIFFSLAYKFKFGTILIFEVKYRGDIKDFDALNKELFEIYSSTEVNLRASLLVFKNNEAFLRINNITDNYQLRSWGNPIKGRHFLVGINLFL